MRIMIDCFDIEYSKEDETYIKIIIRNLKEKNIEITSFFNLEKLSQIVQIKL